MAELITALDYPTASAALNLARQLNPEDSWMKVGMELFIAEPQIMRELRTLGFHIMLDLKLFDIPNTVRGGVRSCCAQGAEILTLHMMGGESMIRGAVEEAAIIADRTGFRPLLFGVTVLTSMGDGDLPGVSEPVSSFAKKLAVKAASWGLDGVVCSGHEAAAIKKENPGLLCLTPGIRPANSAMQDQKRVMTPTMAVKSGSDFLVVGRPITKAENPAEAAADIAEEIRKTQKCM
ncbi:MAG: orotidine-5'-phosphate decarboxylase [Desulfovibrionaceae bacterium]|nr:orotidine-5'-phosphate decarboxylase [Desulfovibrionaceae bacterium]